MASAKLIDVPPLAPVPALAARLSAPAGPARPLLIRHADTSVLALPGRYCVVYIIVVDGKAAVIDVGSAEDMASVTRGLDYLGVARSDVPFVIATHLHFDHVMGLDTAAQALGATLALGSASRQAVEAGTPIHWPRRMGTLRAIPGWVMQGAPAISRTDRARGLGFGFPWSGNRFTSKLGPVLEHQRPLPGFDGWTSLATPGHSSDSICLHHAGAGILVAGDSVRNFRGGEWNGLLDDAERYEATKKLLRALHVSVACPGHGPVLAGDNILSRMATVGFWGRRTLTGPTA